MIAFGHTAVGSIVGAVGYEIFKNQNPALGLITTGVAGLISHYAADLVPHGHFFRHNDYKQKVIWVIIFDLFISIGLFFYLSYLKFGFGLPTWYILFGIGGSQLPDVLDGLIYIGLLPKKALIKHENDFHQSTHWHAIYKNGKLIDGLPWNLVNRDWWQVLMVIFSLIILFQL